MGENRMIHAFFKGIGVKWNANSYDKDLNPDTDYISHKDNSNVPNTAM